MADAIHDCSSDIVDITKYHGREARLEWDIAKLPHHCSYLSLGPGEKGEDKTEPVEQVKWLYEEQRQAGRDHRLDQLSRSRQRVRRRTRTRIRRIVRPRTITKRTSSMNPDAEFLVTMAHPNEYAPEAARHRHRRHQGDRSEAGVRRPRSSRRAAGPESGVSRMTTIPRTGGDLIQSDDAVPAPGPVVRGRAR